MLAEHLGFVSDAVKLGVYKRAVEGVIRPGHVVADVGCGTGVLGLYCLKAGAARVVAIDETSMLDVARQSFERAGLVRHCEFIRSRAQHAVPSQKVDVAICDHVGYFGFDYGIVHLMQDVRRRMLKPGGALVPGRMKLALCLVNSATCRKLTDGWRQDGIPEEFHWLRDKTINERHAVTLRSDELASEPASLGEIDFYQDQPDFFSWSTELSVRESGIVDGLAGWFDCELTEGVWMTNSPLSSEAINRPQAYLPISEPVAVQAGETVKATVMTRPSENMIAWVVDFPAAGLHFRHSTWQGMSLSPADLVRAAPTRVPVQGHAARARQTVLGYCDGQRTSSDIEAAVLRDHPALLPSAAEISSFVAQVLGRDTA